MVDIGITGANGFLAGWLKRELDRQELMYEGLDSEKYASEGFDSFVKGKRCIFHLAGINRSSSDEAFEKGNHLITKELIECIKRQKIMCRIVFASSVQVYGEVEGLVTEKTMPMPAWIYSKTKAAAEDEIISSGLPYSILRISNIFGPGGRPFYNSVIATFLHLVGEGKALTITGSGKQARDFIYVEDVVQSMIHAMAIDAGIYNVTTAKNTQIAEIIGIMQEIMQRKIEIEFKPADEKITSTIFDNSKFRKTGWKPRYSLKMGLIECLKKN